MQVKIKADKVTLTLTENDILNLLFDKNIVLENELMDLLRALRSEQNKLLDEYDACEDIYSEFDSDEWE